MTYTINTECIPSGITPSQYFLMLSLLEEPNTIEIATDLFQKGRVIPLFDPKTRVLRGFDLTPQSRELVREVVEQSMVVKTANYRDLAEKLKKIFPTGRKDGTNRYWTEGVALIERRLKIFERKYGLFSPESILEAADRYVKSFDGNYKYMRTLRYFIWREEAGVGGEIESKSDLLTFLENAGEVEDLRNDWTSELV